MPGLLRAPCPGFQFPDTAFCSGLAGWPEGFSGSVSACHSLRASVCPSGGFLCILTPLPAAEFLSWSRHLPAWAGPCWSSVVWVPLHSQRAGSLHLGVGALGPGASRRAGVSRGLHLPCVAWCLWLCSLGEKVPPGLHALPPAVARTLWVSPGVCAVTADPPHVSRVPVMVGTPCSGPLPHVSSQPHVPTGHTGSWRSAAAGAFVMQSQGCYKRKLVPQSLLSDTHQSTAPRGRTPRETGASAGGSMPPGWWAGQ